MKIGFFAAAAVALLVASCGDAGLPQVGKQSVEIKADDKVHGKADAPVTIIEYASMTCPHCAAFNKDVIPQLNKDYIETGKVKLIFREFPLDSIATLASTVARCFQGDQYFAFIDLLFANQHGERSCVKELHGKRQTKDDRLDTLATTA